METLLILFFFAFGLIIGSFLNVVSLRYNTGVTLGGRSRCFSCNKHLRWYELIPVLSYVALRGRCSACHSRISPQYPLVELLTGILFAGVYLKFGALLLIGPLSIAFLAYYLMVICLLVVILVYDIRHKMIPDGLVYTFILLGLLKMLFTLSLAAFAYPNLLDLLAGPILFLPFFLLWYFSKGTWMGFGDGKLAWGIGWFLGLSAGGSAIALGFWTGAIVGVVLLAVGKFLRARKLTRRFPGIAALGLRSEVPFAPFLILGTLLVFFFSFNFFAF